MEGPNSLVSKTVLVNDKKEAGPEAPRSNRREGFYLL